MPNPKKIENNWSENFKKCPLIDTEIRAFNGKYAYQFFYGKQDDIYPSEYPQNFENLYNTCEDIERNIAIDSLLEFLHFIGIKIQKQNINNHLQKYPDDFSKLIKKCRDIFKALAHSDDTLNINNPYRNNSGDIFFLSRI